MGTRDVTSIPDWPWKPAVPLSAVIGGRIFLGVFDALAARVVLAVQSALTRVGLTCDQISGLTILTTAAYETLDAITMCLTIRIRRTSNMSGVQRILSTLTCPAIGGIVAAMVFVPYRLTHPALLTWATSLPIFCAVDRPRRTPMSYEEMKKHGRQTRLTTRKHFTEEIAGGQMSFRPIDDEGCYLDKDGSRIEDREDPPMVTLCPDRGHPACAGTGLWSPTASNTPGWSEPHPATRNVPVGGPHPRRLATCTCTIWRAPHPSPSALRRQDFLKSYCGYFLAQTMAASSSRSSL